MGRRIGPASRPSAGRRNDALCLANGVLTQLGMSFTHPSMVLSVFVRMLGGSNTLVGLLPAIRFGGWLVPQFLVAGWIQPQPRKASVAAALEIGRSLIYAVLGILTCALGSSYPRSLLVLFFALFVLSRLVAGTGALARTDAIGKIVPPPRRASFFALRNFWGGALVFVAGFLVRYLLEPAHGQAFPSNYALLFGLSCCAFVAAVLTLARVREAPVLSRKPRRSLRAQMARAPALLRRDASFRRYLLIRILLTMMRISGPFYPVFALDVLDAPASMGGFYLSAMTLSAIISNLLWQRVARARDTLYLVQAASLLTALTPLLAAVQSLVMRLMGFTVERYGLLPAYLFTGVFLLAGIGNSGRTIGLPAMLLDIAPDEERTSYVGLVNTVLGFVNFLPILAGAAIDRVGFEPIFFAAAGLLLLGYIATLRWKRRLGVRRAEVV